MVQVSRLRLGVTLWVIGMIGAVLLTLTVVPQLLQSAPTSVPHNIAIAASLIQSGVLLALAAWLGCTLSRPLGLRAPLTEALLSGTNIWSEAKLQLIPGALIGLLAGAVLLMAVQAAPHEVKSAGLAMQIPTLVRLLYGGITEEIIMRWGLMTLIIWLAWRFLQRRGGKPHAAYVGAAILLSALMFGVGHLPAAKAMGLDLSPEVITYILIGNTVPGVLFGFAYWRWGLECAFLAHATAHLVAIAAGAI